MDIMRSWPLHSGSNRYPVPPSMFYLPASNLFSSAECIWVSSEAFHDLPLWAGEYGEMRRKLLDYMIEETTNRLEKKCVDYSKL